MRRIIFLFTISISVLIFSCETKTDIGYDILPDDDILDLNVIDSTSIEVYTLLMDSIATDNVNTLLLGEYIDPIFGYTKTSFVCQYGLAEYPEYTSDYTIDKVVLTLTLDTISEHYGNSAGVQDITVYRLETVLDEDTTYFGNHDPSEFMTGTIIAEQEVSLDTVFNSIDITFNQTFADEFSTVPDSVSSDDDFKNFLKGIYVNSEVQGNDGSIIKVDLRSESVITVYSSDGEARDTFIISGNLSSNVRFNMFEHDYSMTTFYDQIGDETGEQDSVAYVQAMGGLRTKIKFPFIEDLKELGDIAIYRAELVINTESSSITDETNFPVIDNMLLTGYDPENEYYLLPTYASANGYVGVSINENSYSFDIAGYIRDILDGNIENHGLLLFAYSGSTNFERTVITTGNHSDRMKLYITYAKL